VDYKFQFAKSDFVPAATPQMLKEILWAGFGTYDADAWPGVSFFLVAGLRAW
jgi:hypothetical protein